MMPAFAGHMSASYLFVMRMLRAPEPPLAEAVPALFEHLLAVIAPRRLVFTIDAGELRYLTRGERGHWNGEELTNDALTQCAPGEAPVLIDELRDALAAARPERLWVGAEGALLHRAPGTHEPAWYGRWRRQRALQELVEASFAWTGDEREVAIRFPHDGYPLTTSELRAAAAGERWIDDGDPAAAAANRAQLFAVLAALPAVLGVARDDVRWELGGDVQELATRYPDDARAIDAALARLHA